MTNGTKCAIIKIMKEKEVNTMTCKCNDWDCPYNKNGYCESKEAEEKCLDEARAIIKKER